MNRRNFIGSLIAAPAIVRASSLMPVTRIWTPTYYFDGNYYRRSAILMPSPFPLTDGLVPTADSLTGAETIEPQDAGLRWRRTDQWSNDEIAAFMARGVEPMPLNRMLYANSK